MHEAVCHSKKSFTCRTDVIAILNTCEVGTFRTICYTKIVNIVNWFSDITSSSINISRASSAGSFVSINSLNHIGFPFLKNLPTLSVLGNARSAGNTFALSRPRSLNMGITC